MLNTFNKEFASTVGINTFPLIFLIPLIWKLVRDKSSEAAGTLWSSWHLKLIKAESEMQDFCELFSEGLLSLQVLSGSVRRTRQGLQKTLQCFLYMEEKKADAELTLRFYWLRRKCVDTGNYI